MTHAQFRQSGIAGHPRLVAVLYQVNPRHEPHPAASWPETRSAGWVHRALGPFPAGTYRLLPGRR